MDQASRLKRLHLDQGYGQSEARLRKVSLGRSVLGRDRKATSAELRAARPDGGRELSIKLRITNKGNEPVIGEPRKSPLRLEARA